MPDELIVRQCSPTLAGLKTGNLFLTDFSSKEELQKDLRSLNHRLAPKGLRVLPVQYNGKKVLIYLYRPSLLKMDLQNGEASRLLGEMGYVCASPEQCIAKLICRLRDPGHFPHEIGLFLGYPPEDVRGFIENKAGNYKCVGTWKVYGDAKKAQEKFCQYKKCTASYYHQWCKGKSIERLSVAV